MSELDPVLLRGLSAIEPYLGEAVVAGGWVPHIYELLRYTHTRQKLRITSREVEREVTALEIQTLYAELLDRLVAVNVPDPARFALHKSLGALSRHSVVAADGLRDLARET